MNVSGFSFNGNSVSLINGVVGLKGTSSLPLVGTVTLAGTITDDVTYSLVGSLAKVMAGGFSLSSNTVTLANGVLGLAGTLKLSNVGLIPLTGTISDPLTYNLTGSPASLNLGHFTLTGNSVNLTNGLLSLTGTSLLPVVGAVTLSGTFTDATHSSLTGVSSSATTIGGFALGTANLTLVNGILGMTGMVTLPVMGDVVLTGSIADATHYSLAATLPNVAIEGFSLASAAVTLINGVVRLSGTMTIPVVGSVTVSGIVTDNTKFSLTSQLGTLALSPYSLSNAVLRLTNTGLNLAGDASFWGKTCHFAGSVNPDGTFSLNGPLKSVLTLNSKVISFNLTLTMAADASGNVLVSFAGSLSTPGTTGLLNVTGTIAADGSLRIAGVPTKITGMPALETAKIHFAVGATANDVAATVRNVYHTSVNDLAVILNSVGYDLETAVAALISLPGVTLRDAAGALIAENQGPDEFALVKILSPVVDDLNQVADAIWNNSQGQPFKSVDLAQAIWFDWAGHSNNGLAAIVGALRGPLSDNLDAIVYAVSHIRDDVTLLTTAVWNGWGDTKPAVSALVHALWSFNPNMILVVRGLDETVVDATAEAVGIYNGWGGTRPTLGDLCYALSPSHRDVASVAKALYAIDNNLTDVAVAIVNHWQGAPFSAGDLSAALARLNPDLDANVTALSTVGYDRTLVATSVWSVFQNQHLPITAVNLAQALWFHLVTSSPGGLSDLVGTLKAVLNGDLNTVVVATKAIRDEPNQLTQAIWNGWGPNKPDLNALVVALRNVNITNENTLVEVLSRVDSDVDAVANAVWHNTPNLSVNGIKQALMNHWAGSQPLPASCVLKTTQSRLIYIKTQDHSVVTLSSAATVTVASDSSNAITLRIDRFTGVGLTDVDPEVDIVLNLRTPLADADIPIDVNGLPGLAIDAEDIHHL